MRLKRARVQNYRSIHDTGWFDVEQDKTILVGPNEAGKSAALQALQTVNMPPGMEPDLDILRDYPRSRFDEIDTNNGELDDDAPVASVVFDLDDADRELLSEHAPQLANAEELHLTRYYNNDLTHSFGAKALFGKYGDIEKPLVILRAGLAKDDDNAGAVAHALTDLTAAWTAATTLRNPRDQQIDQWLESALPHLDLNDSKVDKAFDSVRNIARMHTDTTVAFHAIERQIPFFVYYSQYFKVRPRIHLSQLADREKAGDIDEEYDFGNLCLLRLLSLSAAELAELGRGVPDDKKDNRGNIIKPTDDEIKQYQDRLDKRSYRLNGASLTLTKDVNKVWGEERKLDIQPDGQHLRVVIINEDGAKVELDQGSEGFRWLVSFYVVFEAQARGEYSNAILLLDEPGLSLHALKQKRFRETVSKIAEKNQTILTTHSPFMIGSEELDKVRIVEMKDRNTGTKVHEDFAVDDPRSLFPLQAHLGYELGQTLFGQSRNLIVEGITDYWYLQAVVEAARDAGEPALDDKVTVIPAGDAGKVVYHAVVLHSQNLKVAALFDSDKAGRTAASDEAFSHLMKPKQILMVKDLYDGVVEHPETEDLLRETLLVVARDEMGIEAIAKAQQQSKRNVCDLLGDVGGTSFSKYKLGKAFINWARTHGWSDLQPHEQTAMQLLFTAVNKGTK